MKRIPKPTEILLWVYGVGLAGMLLPWTHNIFIIIIPLNLLFAAAFLFYGHKPERRVIPAAVFIFITSFIIEAVAVNSGAIFGSYSYGKALGPKLWNTPVIIGLNWFVLLYSTNAIARQLWSILPAGCFRKSSVLLSIAFVTISGSLLMVFYDLLLEPAATRLDMWTWQGEVIPFRNFMAWFVISLFYQLVIRLAGEDRLNSRALPLWFVQLVFFAVIDLFYFVL